MMTFTLISPRLYAVPIYVLLALGIATFPKNAAAGAPNPAAMKAVESFHLGSAAIVTIAIVNNMTMDDAENAVNKKAGKIRKMERHLAHIVSQKMTLAEIDEVNVYFAQHPVLIKYVSMVGALAHIVTQSPDWRKVPRQELRWGRESPEMDEAFSLWFSAYAPKLTAALLKDPRYTDNPGRLETLTNNIKMRLNAWMSLTLEPKEMMDIARLPECPSFQKMEKILSDSEKS
jgi:hypothetical protein